jgi:hypothetical protein
MVDYDFRTLNDKEFEVLVMDLLSKRDGHKYERFKPGKDAGVDGRFLHSDSHEIIVQCKHRPSKSIAAVCKHLATEELPKLHRLKPKRYIVALSHPLSRDDKRRVLDEMKPYINHPQDILGREDLNDLLSSHSDVEKRHFKLWLTSTTILDLMLNKAIHERSQSVVDDAINSAAMYAITPSHAIAADKLDKLGTVIITGAAGVGKTTLANALLLEYVTRGYSPIVISEEIREAENVFLKDTKQIFFFDDFLGRNYMEALSGHEGSHIVNFIGRIQRDKQKRFVLTSRSTILNQGKLLIDLFKEKNLNKNEFEITVESFRDIDKANILYNHIWHSSLETSYIDEIYRDKRYRKVIFHRNFNPRLIRFITDHQKLNDCPPSSYWEHIVGMLENPADVWRNSFEAQLDEHGRIIVLLVTLQGRPISQTDLAEAYARYMTGPYSPSATGHRDFIQCLQHLSGSMLSRAIHDHSTSTVNLFNPSIGDYVIRRYAANIPALQAGLLALRSVSSVDSLRDIAANQLLSAAEESQILNFILTKADADNFLGFSPEYVATALANLSHPIDPTVPQDLITPKAARFIAEAKVPSRFQEMAEVLTIALNKKLIATHDAQRFVEESVDKLDSTGKIDSLTLLAQSLPTHESSRLLDLLSKSTAELIAESPLDEFSPSDICSELTSPDVERAENTLKRAIQARFDSLGLPLSNESLELIMDAFNVQEVIYDYFANSHERDIEDHPLPTPNLTDEIDDLFERAL